MINPGNKISEQRYPEISQKTGFPGNARIPILGLFQLFRVLPNSFVCFIQGHKKFFSWISVLFAIILLVLTFWFSAYGPRLHDAPDFDLLFGIFFKDILIPMFFLLVAWYIIALKNTPEKISEYQFLNSLPVSSRILFFHFLLLDFLRYSWVPGGLIVLYFGLRSFTPLSFLIRLDILTILTFANLIILNTLFQLLVSKKKSKKGGFGYPSKVHPMIQFTVIFFFALLQITWVIFPQLITGLFFWLVVLILMGLIIVFLISTFPVFTQWQRSNTCFKFAGRNVSEKRVDYHTAAKFGKFLSFLRHNPLLIKNLVRIGIEKSSLANGALTFVFILISYLIAMNNETFEDRVPVLLGLFGIYSFGFALRSMYQTSPESASTILIYSLPLKKYQFYLSVFTLSLLGLFTVFSILTTFLILSGSGLTAALGFWWRAFFFSLIFLVIAFNFAFSHYPELKIAQKRFFYYLMILTVIVVSFYKFRYLIAIGFMFFSFFQLRKMKLYRLS